MDGSIQRLTPELSIKTQRGMCSLYVCARSNVRVTRRVHPQPPHPQTPHPRINTPELGADIILTLDECTPFHVDKAYTEASMERSHRWELRSLAEFIREDDGTQVKFWLCVVWLCWSVPIYTSTAISNHHHQQIHQPPEPVRHHPGRCVRGFAAALHRLRQRPRLLRRGHWRELGIRQADDVRERSCLLCGVVRVLVAGSGVSRPASTD